MQRICESVRSYGPTLFADIVDAERCGPRVVLAGEHFTAYVPFAARWPVEIHLAPHRHVPDLAATTTEERDELATITLRLTRALDALYDAPLPYIGSWLQAPVGPERDTVRLSWRLTSPRRSADKLKYLAGSESGMGAWIADVAPEAAAARLRDALAKADALAPTEPLAI
jgi:UDPglucose--hexose-1-phosphate uridylyltransferase